MAKQISKDDLRTIRLAAARKGMLHDSEIAEAVGMNRCTWSRKINGVSSFTVDDVEVIRDKLGLTDKQTYDIFFGRK